MKPINIARPVFNEGEIHTHLVNEYGLNGILKTLPSERDQNSLLTDDNKNLYVCKIASLNEEKKNLVDQNTIIKHLHSKNANSVPQLIPSINQGNISIIQTTNGSSYYFRVMSYLPGIVYADFKPHSSEFMYSLGEFMAEIRIALEDIKLNVDKKQFNWDIEYGLDTINKHIENITNDSELKLIKNYLQQYRDTFQNDLKDLEEGIIHGDANDYNVIVQNPSEMLGPVKFGLIDFGDFVYSRKISDLAVTIAYAILDKPNPMTILMDIVKGYNSKFRLNESEMKILFPMVIIRLCVSVAMSA
ncbi:MAG: phosphotransferase, partial [Candidatus Kariarchaeaceae archaeon]